MPPVIVAETFHARAVPVGKMPNLAKYCLQNVMRSTFLPCQSAGLAAFGNRMITL
jgi:hypothetical protein